MDERQILILISLIGICTYFIRVIFVIYSPNVIKNHYVETGLKSVPSSMLIALVIPFLLFTDAMFDPFRIDVLAIILAIPLIHYFKKYQIGLIFALMIYIILDLIL